MAGRIFAYLTVDGMTRVSRMAGRIFAYLTVDGIVLGTRQDVSIIQTGQNKSTYLSYCRRNGRVSRMAGRIFAYLTVDGMTRVSTPHGSSSKKKTVPGCDLAHGLSLNEAVIHRFVRVRLVAELG
jgi:hypothetical protein